MARGWESKAIESQQEEIERRRGRSAPATADRAADLRRDTLALARRRVEADLARAVSAAHRAQLTATLTAIDSQLRELGAAADRSSG
jgi:hypothetical protein